MWFALHAQFAVAATYNLCNTVCKHSIEVTNEARAKEAFGVQVARSKVGCTAIAGASSGGLGGDAAIGIRVGNGSQLTFCNAAGRAIRDVLRVRTHAAFW